MALKHGSSPSALFFGFGLTEGFARGFVVGKTVREEGGGVARQLTAAKARKRERTMRHKYTTAHTQPTVVHASRQKKKKNAILPASIAFGVHYRGLTILSISSHLVCEALNDDPKTFSVFLALLGQNVEVSILWEGKPAVERERGEGDTERTGTLTKHKLERRWQDTSEFRNDAWLEE